MHHAEFQASTRRRRGFILIVNFEISPQNGLIISFVVIVSELFDKSISSLIWINCKNHTKRHIVYAHTFYKHWWYIIFRVGVVALNVFSLSVSVKRILFMHIMRIRVLANARTEQRAGNYVPFIADITFHKIHRGNRVPQLYKCKCGAAQTCTYAPPTRTRADACTCETCASFRPAACFSAGDINKYHKHRERDACLPRDRNHRFSSEGNQTFNNPNNRFITDLQ